MDPRRLALIRTGTAGQQRSVGSGYLVAPRLVLTARHVLVDGESGSRWPEVRVRVGHPNRGGMLNGAAAEVWKHPSLDVALVLLDADTGIEGTVSWGRPVGQAPLRYEGLGFPLASLVDEREVEHLRGELPPLSSGSERHYVLDQDPVPDSRADRTTPWAGASGAAVFCEDHLVGVVVRAGGSFGTGRLRACSAQALLADGFFGPVLAEYAAGPPQLVDIGAALPAERPAAQYTDWEREIERALWQWVPEAAAQVAQYRSLADKFGYRIPYGEQPSIERLTAMVTAHPRGLASLSGTLVAALRPDHREEVARLLVRARALQGSPLLSIDEHDRLLDLLGRVAKERPALLPHASREALRYAVLPESLTRPGFSADDLRAAVEGLEAMPDGEQGPVGTPSVPALVRVVEYVAAAVDAATGDQLRTWSDTVARRTGIHLTALGERRADARQWAARSLSPVSRVVMELTGVPGSADERYTCRILLVRQDGTRTVLHEPETVPRTPEQIARCLQDAVESVDAEPSWGMGVPWVTVVVDRQGLHVAVDEWNPGAPNELLPGQPIGVDYRVTMSCPEISEIVRRRDADQRRRWAAGSSAALTTDHTTATADQLRHRLETDHRDTARVVLHGPPEQRTTMLTYCLALGVPVILWDRQAACFEDADKLGRLEPVGPLPDLAERLRAFRGATFVRPEAAPARPSLVWEDGNGTPQPEPLHLTDPGRTHAT
ncbi:VMAP-C domain-containing protein [Kitasatospora fiedleri]|uniref:VMAP-C domain-containing protein n=1 Tax=Kitasatospora fiedleri TaxID=2991545 RepID=UPI00249B1F4F|nr:hypothetical protein [Kitasatospora fiedleri]